MTETTVITIEMNRNHYHHLRVFTPHPSLQGPITIFIIFFGDCLHPHHHPHHLFTNPTVFLTLFKRGGVEGVLNNVKKTRRISKEVHPFPAA